MNIRLEQFPDEQLAEQVMRFGSSLRGTRSFWHKAKNELTDMISQLGCPTFFFTLSAADTKWSDLHAIMPGCLPYDIAKQQKWRNDNIISNPHLTSLYMHHRFIAFREIILEKNLNTKDYWYRYAFYRIFFSSNYSNEHSSPFAKLSYKTAYLIGMNGNIGDLRTSMVSFG